LSPHQYHHHQLHSFDLLESENIRLWRQLDKVVGVDMDQYFEVKLGEY